MLHRIGDGRAAPSDALPATVADGDWVWLDVLVEPDDDIGELHALADGLQLDGLALRDAMTDVDLPKVDDFGHHLLVVLHGLRADRIATYQLDCFLTDRYLVTVRRDHSPTVEALWEQLPERPELCGGGADQLLARLADVLTRRFVSVLDAFDASLDELTDMALAADSRVVADVVALRSELARVRRAIQPQREAIDLLRHSTSPLMSDAGRRRFSDVFDVASRIGQGLDAARTALTEALGVYEGAEARVTGTATRVLTIYAAIMLPLSLIAGFFGMNNANLPLIDKSWGWIAVTVAMAVVAVVSLGIFVAAGWIHRPSGRQAGATLGRGLAEAARTPVQLVEAVYEISTMPLRVTARRAFGIGRDEPED